jgi:amino acid transporter
MRANVDNVAWILALSLAVTLFLLVVAIFAQIFVSSNNPMLSGPASQTIDSALTGIIGVLGSYIGYTLRDKHDANGKRQNGLIPPTSSPEGNDLPS